MHTLSTLLTAGSLASLALAKPIPQASNTKKGFTVTGSIPKPLPVAKVQYANVFRKYGKPVPSNLAAAAASGTASVVNNPEAGDVSYLCEVTVGSQTLSLDFDTGSADLWVFSTELPSSESSGHTLYDPSQAQQLQGATWNITYGDGSGASGNVYQDSVTVGGLTVTNQAVEAAEQVSSQFVQDTQNDGLLGLAFSSINTVQPTAQTTWFDTAQNEGLLESYLFTADLKHNAPGSYDFGYIDTSKATGDITYTPVNNANGFWEFTGTGYGIAGNFNSQSIDAIADTGTTLLLMDDSVVSDYYGNVNGAENDSSQGGYVFDCSTDLPDFSLGIGSAQATIPGSLMNLGPVSSGSSQCFGGLQSNSGLGMSIYGDVFLKAVFAVFDAGNTQFGWAPKDTGASSSGNSTDTGDDSGY